MDETMHIIERSAAEYQEDLKDTGIFLSMIFPVYGTYQYFWLQKQAKWFKSINFSVTHVFSTLHNLGLHLFSVYIFTSLFGVMLEHGIVNDSCTLSVYKYSSAQFTLVSCIARIRSEI